MESFYERGGVVMKLVRFFVMLLMVIGSLNWGLIGFFGYNVVSAIFEGMLFPWSRIVYAVVGLAGVWGIGLICCCSKGGSSGSSDSNSHCGCNKK